MIDVLLQENGDRLLKEDEGALVLEQTPDTWIDSIYSSKTSPYSERDIYSSKTSPYDKD